MKKYSRKIRKYKKFRVPRNKMTTNVCVAWHTYEYNIGTNALGTDGDSINIVLSSFSAVSGLASVFKSYRIQSYGLEIYPRSYNGTTTAPVT